MDITLVQLNWEISMDALDDTIEHLAECRRKLDKSLELLQNMKIIKPICDVLTEYIIEEGWQKSRKFMQEIEREFECQGKLPINLLLANQNLAIKWLQFALRN